MRRLLQHPATQAVLVWLGGLYLSFALRTTRWEFDGAEHLDAAIASQAAVGAFWHERLALMPRLWLTLQHQAPGRRAHVLVSRHRDGRLIGALMRRFGVDVVLRLLQPRRRGRRAVGAAACWPAASMWSSPRTARAGRGGSRRRGVAQIAAMAGVTVLPCAAQTSRRRVLANLGPHGRPAAVRPRRPGLPAADRRAARGLGSGPTGDRGGADRGGGSGGPPVRDMTPVRDKSPSRAWCQEPA